MRCVWTLLRPAVQAVALILLGSLVCGSANVNDLPEQVLFKIGEHLRHSLRTVAPHEGPSRLKNHLQSFEHVLANMSELGHRARQLYGNEVAAARWLSSVTCVPVGPVPIRWPPWYDPTDNRYFECVEQCVKVELGWSLDTAAMLPVFLGARWLWAQAPVLLSVSRRSWAVLDAADLATQIHARAAKRLRRCVGYPPNWIPEWISGASRGQDTPSVQDMVETMAGNSSRFGIEQLHIAMHEHDPQSVIGESAEMLDVGPLQRLLPGTTFSTLATSLLAARFLRHVTISWDVPRTTHETFSLVKEMAATLTKSTSVKKLALLRTCSDQVKQVRPDPLAAFAQIASAGGYWRSIQTLSLLTHRGESDSYCPPSYYELEALPTLAEHMPALRRIHFEFHFKIFEPSALQWPELENLLPLVPPDVTVTVASNRIGFAGVARATSLALLGESVSKGYAVVLSAPHVRRDAPRPQLELVGRKVLAETTALTVLYTFEQYGDEWGLDRNAQLDWLPLRLPRLERLAIDSRWTESYCNKLVAQLPPRIGSRLRALLVHTIVLWKVGPCAAIEVLQGVLQAGSHISAVDLGMAFPRRVTNVDVKVVQRLAVTLSRMPRLEHVSLTLTSARHADVSALGDRISHYLPSARITLVSDRSLRWWQQHAEYDHHGMPVWWQVNLSAAVPPTPAFPSPRQFFDQS